MDTSKRLFREDMIFMNENEIIIIEILILLMNM